MLHSVTNSVKFFPCGWVPNTFENMVALNTAVDLKSLHSFGELAYATC